MGIGLESLKRKDFIMDAFLRRAFGLAWIIAVVLFGWTGAASSEGMESRDFHFTYVARIPPASSGKMLRVWIPLPQTDAYQRIGALKIDSPFPYEKRRDAEYGNEYVYLQIPAGQVSAPAEVNVSFQARRQEHRVALDQRVVPAAEKSGGDPPNLQRYLEPDRRVPIQGMISELSAQETRGISEPLGKARAIYDYVLATMRYDKSGTGWGNGDAIWACTAKRGNCTDFHSLLIGMMRAAGIPARFEIGFPLPADQHAGNISGYHCWAEFYLPQLGWIPVDASEAWKHPEKRNYFFGAHDDNRVQFTVGRDIRLEPAQQGAPLNYFVYPYAELDGAAFAVESRFSFEDLQQASN